MMRFCWLLYAVVCYHGHGEMFGFAFVYGRVCVCMHTCVGVSMSTLFRR